MFSLIGLPRTRYILLSVFQANQARCFKRFLLYESYEGADMATVRGGLDCVAGVF